MHLVRSRRYMYQPCRQATCIPDQLCKVAARVDRLPAGTDGIVSQPQWIPMDPTGQRIPERRGKDVFRQGSTMCNRQPRNWQAQRPISRSVASLSLEHQPIRPLESDSATIEASKDALLDLRSWRNARYARFDAVPAWPPLGLGRFFFASRNLLWRWRLVGAILPIRSWRSVGDMFLLALAIVNQMAPFSIPADSQHLLSGRSLDVSGQCLCWLIASSRQTSHTSLILPTLFSESDASIAILVRATM